MPLETNVQITPENCERLSYILDLNKPVELGDYRFIEAIVRVRLFSRYPKRRVWGERELQRFLRNPYAQIHTLKKDGFLWAYISLTRTKDAFLFVDKYPATLPYLEPVPTEGERRYWAKKQTHPKSQYD